MKTKHLIKTILSLFLFTLCAQAWGEDTTETKVTLVSPSAQNTDGCIVGVLAEDKHTATWNADNAFTMTQHQNSSTSSVYLSYNEIRLYKYHDFTFVPTKGIYITSIKATLTTDAYVTNIQKAKLENCTVSSSSKTVTFTPTDKTQPVVITHTENAVYVSKIEVTYTGTPIIGPDGQKEASLAFDAAEATAYLDDAEDFTPPSLIKNPSTISNIVFSSSNTSVATVDSQTGAITLNAEGETTITALCSETDEHTAAEANYLLTVKANKPVTTEVAIVAQNGEYWFAATTKLNSSNNKLNAISVTVKNGQVVYTGEEDIVWLWNEKEGTLTNKNGDVLSTSSKSSAETEVSYSGNNKKWSINETFGIVNDNTVARALLVYNNSVFGNYAKTNLDTKNYSSKAQLLHIVSEATPETEEVTTNSLGWATFAPSKNVEMPKLEDVSVYYIKSNRADEKYAYVSDAKQVITEGTTMAAGTGVLIKAEAGTVVKFPVNETCQNVIDANSMNNALVGVTAEKGLAYDASRTNAYIFTKNNEDKIGFYKWGSGTLAKGKCYLQLSPSAAQAPQFLVLSEDRVTSIADAFGAEPLKTQESTYNLSGQKVNGAYKGIIIRNNKKYVKK